MKAVIVGIFMLFLAGDLHAVNCADQEEPECGCIMAYIDSVAARYNGYYHGCINGCLSCDGDGTYGGQYQCVELVKRFHYRADWSGDGGTYFETAEQKDLVAYARAVSDVLPEHGDILCWDQANHVALVDQVTSQGGGEYDIRIVEQNWNIDGNRHLTLKTNENGKLYFDNTDIQGWLRSPDYYTPTFIGACTSRTPDYPPGCNYYPVTPGQVLPVSFTFRNDGTAYWTNDGNQPFYVELHSVTDQYNADSPSDLVHNWIDGSNVVITTTTGRVDAEGQGLYSFEIQAPMMPGEYYLYVALYRPHTGQYFSDSGPMLKIRVSSINEGLAAYWNFNEGTAIDNSGAGHNGVIYGALPTSGVYGQGMAFDGLDDYIDIGDVDELEDADDLSISLWVNFASFGVPGHCGPNCMPILSKHYSSPNYPDLNSYILTEKDGILSFTVGDPSGTVAGIQCNHDFIINTWHHLAITYHTGETSMYIDGQEQTCGQTLIVTHINNSNQPLRLGAWYHLYNPEYMAFHGNMDEVRFYNRTLTAEEVTMLYEQEEPALVNEAETVMPPSYTIIQSESGRLDDGQSTATDIIVDLFFSLYRGILNFPGSELQLSVYRPDGTLFEQWSSTQPPLQLAFMPDTAGEWTFTATAIDIPYEDYPYALVVGVSEEYWVPGDANEDSLVNVSDAVYIINFVFIPGAPAPIPYLAGDTNCDELVNVSDAVFIINYVFIPGSPPPCIPWEE